MTKKLFSLIIGILLYSTAFAQYDFRLFGYITDEETGEPIVGAQISLPDWQTETYSNNFGYFSISVPPQDFVVEYSYGGYLIKRDSVYVIEDIQVDVHLKKVEVDESQINNLNKSQSDITNPVSGKIDVPTGLLKELPYIMSEPDLIKGLQSFPGITSGNEYFSNLYVRGGAADQNLTLLDGAPVYNGTHIFGLLSIFQPDITNSIQLYKAGFPARYGGRVSSVIDITSNEGNKKEFYGRGSMGFLIAKISMNGPIGKNERTTYSLGIRRSYWDALKIFQSPDANPIDIFVVSDYNLKVKHKWSKYDYVIFSVYAGRDKYPIYFSDSFVSLKRKMEYGNASSIIRWNHIFSPKLFCNLSLSATRYKVKDNIKQTQFDSLNQKFKSTTYNYFNGISDISINGDFEYSMTNYHTIHFGLQNTNHFINPGYSEITTSDNSTIENSGKKKGFFSSEFAVYGEDDYKVNSKLKLNMGLRVVYFANAAYNYNPLFLEPRISGRYILKPTLALKASYAKMHQNVFLLTNSGIGYPFNFWVPATEKVPAQSSDIFNIGMAKELNNGYKVSVDAYYKALNNVLFAKEEIGVFDNGRDWQSIIETGKASNYGLELLVNKNSGYLTGWLGYTLAFANQKFENLNLGKSFEFSFNRRHTLNLVLNYRITQWNSVFLNLTLASGRYFTIPGGKYRDIDGNLILDYSSLNNYKGPIFQRIDIGALFERNKTNRIFEQQAYLTLYNALLAKNPINIYAEFTPNATNPALSVYKLKKTSIPFFIPGLSYIIRF
jgi:hypothetical protein